MIISQSFVGAKRAGDETASKVRIALLQIRNVVHAQHPLTYVSCQSDLHLASYFRLLYQWVKTLIGNFARNPHNQWPKLETNISGLQHLENANLFRSFESQTLKPAKSFQIRLSTYSYSFSDWHHDKKTLFPSGRLI